jgi:FKBP-type peptidyl-prolyl cis-trans isomerase FkpA
MTQQLNRLNNVVTKVATKFVMSACIGAAALICAPLAMAADASAPEAPAATAAVGVNGMITNASGLQYRDLKVGTGAVAQLGQSVTVHYTGWLQNADGSRGNKFDSSRDHGQPFVFGLGQGQVIKGWDEGVQGMKIGGQRRLVIPSVLGYGARNVGGGLIPPNSTLIFEVELLKTE